MNALLFALVVFLALALVFSIVHEVRVRDSEIDEIEKTFRTAADSLASPTPQAPPHSSNVAWGRSIRVPPEVGAAMTFASMRNVDVTVEFDARVAARVNGPDLVVWKGASALEIWVTFPKEFAGARGEIESVLKAAKFASDDSARWVWRRSSDKPRPKPPTFN
jgi:hypothetical protein